MRIALSTVAVVTMFIALWGEPGASQMTPPPSAPISSLEGTSWKLAALPGRTLVQDVSSTVTFGPAGALSGSDGCNRYTGTWAVSGRSLTLTPGGTTMMACPEPIMKQAGAFTKALAATRGYNMDAGELVLMGAGGERVAILVTQPAATLRGTAWQASMVNNGKGAVASLVTGTTITATFGTDGTLTGSAGCNRYTSTYKTSGDTITIAPAAATRKMCKRSVMEQEQSFLAALGQATTYRLGETTLELRNASGAMQVSFRAPK